MNTKLKCLLRWQTKLTYALVALVILSVGTAHAQRDSSYLGPPYLNPNLGPSSPPGPRTGLGPGILPNVLINNDRQLDGPSENQSELAVAACGGVVVAGFNDCHGLTYPTVRNGITGWGYSTDGGFTWTDGVSLPLFNPNDFGTLGDPSLYVDSACNFYFSNLYNPGPLGGYRPLPISVHTGRFDPNLGRVIWNRPALINEGSIDADKEHIAVDPRTSGTTAIVYVAYVNYAISPRQIEVARSTDGGQTWSTLVLASGNVQGPIPRVGPSGEVYVAWENWPAAPRAIKIRKAGTWPNFGAETLVTNVMPIAQPIYMSRVNEFPAMAIDTTVAGTNSGRVYVAWNDGRFGGAGNIGSILLTHSPDGTTWSTLRMVNDDGNPSDTLTPHWFPWVSVNANAVVYLGWYDRRLRTTDDLTDVFAASFTVAGGVSPNKRLTDQSFSMIVPGRCTPKFGDYNQGYATNTTFHFCWGDGRLGDPDAFSGGWIF